MGNRIRAGLAVLLGAAAWNVAPSRHTVQALHRIGGDGPFVRLFGSPDEACSINRYLDRIPSSKVAFTWLELDREVFARTIQTPIHQSDYIRIEFCLHNFDLTHRERIDKSQFVKVNHNSPACPPPRSLLDELGYPAAYRL